MVKHKKKYPKGFDARDRIIYDIGYNDALEREYLKKEKEEKPKQWKH